MKVLVATRATQGRKSTDVFEAVEGELVVLELCSDCGPRTLSFRGVESHGVTTTTLLVDRPEIEVHDFLDLIETDYAKHFHNGDDLTGMQDFHCLLIRESIAFQCSLNELKPGYIIRRKGLEVYARPLKQVS